MKYTLVIAAACLANVTHGFVPMVPRNTFLSQIIGVEMLATPEAEGAHESDPTQISVAAEVPQADKGGKAVKPKKSKKVPPKKLTARERTGYVYRDEEGLYDVPLINEAKWYRLSVRKASEKRLTEAFNELARSGKWAKIIEEAFYPSSSYVKFKGKNLCLDSKPMVPGLVYVKTQMSPDIADDLEQVHGIYGFSKNNFGIVVPLGQEEAEQIEIMKRRQVKALSPELLKMKKEEYVTVVSGPHKGKYGILMGAKKGRLEVCLRSDYRDEWDIFSVDDLRYLEEPPEKKWKTMSAKEAVESLMAKDPKNPTIRSLRDQGLLEEILYPDGRSDQDGRRHYMDRDGGTWDESRGKGGREGGARVRSIAKGDHQQGAPQRKPVRTFDTWAPHSHGGASISGSASVAQGMDSWGGSGGGDASERQWSSSSDAGRAEPQGEVDDFDSFIEDLLNDFDPSPQSKGKEEGTTSASGPSSPWGQAAASNLPVSSSDRTDSERILDELLGDIDAARSRASTPSRKVTTNMKGVPPGGPRASKGLQQHGNRAVPARGAKRGERTSSTAPTLAPKMEDFGSFEQYLDALVSHERSSPLGTAGEGMAVSADDDLMAVLDANVDGVGVGNAIEQSEKTPRRISLDGSGGTASTPEDILFEDDLGSFLDSLDDLGMDNSSRLLGESSGGGGDALKEKTVQELRALLKGKGLPVTGKKADLIKRLTS